MRVLSLLYHDICESDDPPSGFAGGEADIYKIDPGTFTDHMAAVAGASAAGAPIVIDSAASLPADSALTLTFDDGGVSAIHRTADQLEARGWRGHFFMTTDRIGATGFLNAAQLRELRERGHVIGSHSHSHPPRMSACSSGQLRLEWEHSRHILEDLLGTSVLTASVPGGYFSPRVAQAASDAGIEILFTSEPRRDTWRLGPCHLMGRFSIMQGTDLELVRLAVADAAYPWLRQRAIWEAKKVAKRFAGDAWLALRRRVFRRN